MSQREKCDAYSAKPEAKSSKRWPEWVTTGIGVFAACTAIALIVGVVRAGMSVGEEAGVKIRSMGENELWIYRASGVFADVVRRPGSKEVVVQGETNKDVETEVFIDSVDNITVEYRTDGKNFPTIKLTGRVADGAAEGAVILVPANDASYYEEARREVHARHSSYGNCSKCNPGKK